MEVHGIIFLLFITHSNGVLQTAYKKETSSHTVTVCRGQMRSITCPNLQLLHIFNAFYGKLSGHDCQDPVTQLRDQMPTCFSKNAPTIIRQACQGQQSCDLYAEDSLYHNPCPTVDKYLYVSFTCQGKSELGEKLKMFQNVKPSNMASNMPLVRKLAMDASPFARHDVTENTERSAVVCPGQTSSILCRNLNTLRIKSAFYGKHHGRNCLGKPTNDIMPTCYAKDAVAKIKGMCDNQQSCDLFSEPQLYGRTLCKDDTQSYLQLVYTCRGRSDLRKQLVVTNRAEDRSTLMLRSNLPRPFQQPGNYGPQSQWLAQRQTPWYSRSLVPVDSPWQSGRISNAYTTGYRRTTCDQCDGNCNNYLCYGCGGCSVPPPEKQMYYYPYQKQDAVYHDAFHGNEMSLSGLIVSPLPNALKKLLKKHQIYRS